MFYQFYVSLILNNIYKIHKIIFLFSFYFLPFDKRYILKYFLITSFCLLIDTIDYQLNLHKIDQMEKVIANQKNICDMYYLFLISQI